MAALEAGRSRVGAGLGARLEGTRMSRCEDYPCCGHGEGGCPGQREARPARRSAGRFSDYREITARYRGTADCGHAVSIGDRIGYARGRGIRCAACWSKWVSENAAAEADERQYASGY